MSAESSGGGSSGQQLEQKEETWLVGQSDGLVRPTAVRLTVVLFIVRVQPPVER